MSSRGKGSPDQKLRILLEGLSGRVDISELCRQKGLHPTQFYQWKKQLLSGASRVFESERMKPSARETRLQAELARAKDVIAKITSENVGPKKGFRFGEVCQTTTGIAPGSATGGEKGESRCGRSA